MIRIGILGMSEGNAHPSSWSAIINGKFDADGINRLGFPGVTQYLQTNRAVLGIPGAAVTHIWSQEEDLSTHIAQTAGIPHIVSNATDLIGKIDAVILARDDAENHRQMAEPFLKAGVPIFIDKPLCDNMSDLNYFSNWAEKGAFLMSCSSMRYSTELRTLRNNLQSLGTVELITAVGKKDWIKYGVHMLEAVFTLVDDIIPISVTQVGTNQKHIVVIEFETGVKAVIHLFEHISSTFQLTAFGTNNWQMADMKDFFGMFRDNIIDFVRSVKEGKPRLPFSKTAQIMRVLIGAQESLQDNGKTIQL